MAEPVRFDQTLGAWLVSRYDDVTDALRNPQLSATSRDADMPSTPVDAARTAHTVVRTSAGQALSVERLETWREHAAADAQRMVAALPVGLPVDLVATYAAPWSFSLAMHVNGVDSARDDVNHLRSLAHDVFFAAATTTDPSAPLDPRVAASTAELARALPHADAVIGVQSFIALSHTLPCALAGAWLTLAQHPAVWTRLRADRELVPNAVDELLRLASPARAVFRRARAPLQLGEANIPAGDRVILLLAAANRDPAQFPQPDALDIDRAAASAHLGFGRGTHHCAGTTLIRMAMGVATTALLDHADRLEPARPPSWTGGFAIDGPSALPITLHTTEHTP